jgi:hypothetical protein
MLKKFLHGVIFGSGFGVAFFTIWLIGISYILPIAFEKASNNELDMSGAKSESIVTLKKEQSSKREFNLYKIDPYERIFPVNGGMLSIVILDEDSGKDRPNSFQAWVTETSAFIIKTVDDVPTVKEVPYKTNDPVNFASNLVQDSAGFHEQNSTITVSESEIARIKSGEAPKNKSSLNGELRITENGVIFILPNKYE